MRVYLALPDGLPDDVVKALRDAIEGTGHAILEPPAPARAGLAVSEREHFLAVVDRLLEADVLVVEATQSSTSVGWSAAWFLAKGRLVVVCARRDARLGVSPMLTGNPSPWQRLILYDDHEDLTLALRALLSS